MGNSKIEWTEKVWNPMTGCTKVSEGCRHCYAEAMARRLKEMGQPRYCGGFKVSIHWDLIEKPKEWKTPRTVFVDSMGDLFHEQVPDGFIRSVFKTMTETDWHRYIILTKRPARMASMSLYWPDNVMAGVSVECDGYADRIDLLRRTRASTRVVSFEPLLGPINRLNLIGIHWVIAGGESGPHARRMMPAWACGIRDACVHDGVPFFFKQWGAYDEHGRRVGKKHAGRMLEGKEWREMP